jgi:hypothetical protein
MNRLQSPNCKLFGSEASIAPMELFADGKIDAWLGFPPEPQELRARKVGHVVVNSSIDRPWSQYYCCMLGGNRDFIRRNPVATKRVLRAMWMFSSAGTATVTMIVGAMTPPSALAQAVSPSAHESAVAR